MQAYDLIMIIVLAIATILGAIKGFAWQVASLASILVSYLVAVNFRMDLAKMIQAAPPWNMFLAMLILYVGTSFVIWVGFRLLSGVIDGVRLKEFDRHLGALFGLAKGAIFCLLITMFAMTLLGPKQQEAICRSRSGYYIASALDSASGVLPKEIHDVVGPYLARLDEKLHQQFPAGGQTDNVGGGLWPNLGIGTGGPGTGNAGSTSAAGGLSAAADLVRVSAAGLAVRYRSRARAADLTSGRTDKRQRRRLKFRFHKRCHWRRHRYRAHSAATYFHRLPAAAYSKRNFPAASTCGECRTTVSVVCVTA